MARSIEISIHAPREGSDEDVPIELFPVCLFQSTLPVRGATPFTYWLYTNIATFQSTLPVRGATVSRSLFA